MFLNFYLFLSNILFISFTMIYLRFIDLDDKINDINKLKNKINNTKKIVKKSKNSQLKYISNNHKIRDIEWKLFKWKVLSFMVVIFMALNIIKTEPLIIFGIKLRYTLILIILILNYIFTILLKKLGVKI